MTRAEKSKALAMDILRACSGHPPSEILTALTLATAQVVLDAGREDKTIEDHVAVQAETFRKALTWMMEDPPVAGRLQ
jgi:hypothetical protein